MAQDKKTRNFNNLLQRL